MFVALRYVTSLRILHPANEQAVRTWRGTARGSCPFTSSKHFIHERCSSLAAEANEIIEGRRDRVRVRIHHSVALERKKPTWMASSSDLRSLIRSLLIGRLVSLKPPGVERASVSGRGPSRAEYTVSLDNCASVTAVGCYARVEPKEGRMDLQTPLKEPCLKLHEH